ncbi:MAG: 4-hydroxy-tetrahydrodipicolinate synthase [Defluviicoccus sp.]|nr:4-hydroxy-tetrahydrodipicolinate synthase [Defluviicoccus sp.]
MMDLPKGFLRGSIPPLITPFRDGAVDYAAYAEMVEFQIREGSHGILVNGTTSEPATLTVAERNRAVDVAVEAAAGRVPIVAATGSQSFADTEALTLHAEKAGADALLIVTPYFIRPPQRGLAAYYLELARRTELPWMIYHIPGRAAVSVTLETLCEIADKAPNFVGMKHAVDDLGFVSRYPMMAVGACGLMNAVGNLRPARLAAMCEAVWEGDLKKAQDIHYALFEINQAVFYDTNPIPIKYMMRRVGLIPENAHRLPMVPALPELERRLDGVLERAGMV